MRKKIALFVLLGWVLLIVGDRVDELRVYQGAQIAMYTIALASIVLLTGYSGQVSLGNGAMMAVGGYAAALTLNNLQTPIWFAFLMEFWFQLYSVRYWEQPPLVYLVLTLQEQLSR